MNYPDLLAAIFDALAIITAVIAILISLRANRSSSRSADAAQLSARSAADLLAMERVKLAAATDASTQANVVVKRRRSDQVEIFNRGPATARNIRVFLDGKPLDDHYSLVHPNEGSITDAVLAAEQKITYTYSNDHLADVRFPV